MFPKIETYSAVVPLSVQERLMENNEALSKSHWNIADCVIDVIAHVYDEQLKGHHNDIGVTDIYKAVAHFTDLSWKRVGKIAVVGIMFDEGYREKYKKWGFGYFEKAYELENPEGALEFLDFFVNEYGREPEIQEVAYLYNKHILGKITDGGDQPPVPEVPKGFDSPLYKINTHIREIREYVKLDPRYERVRIALKVLEEALEDAMD